MATRINWQPLPWQHRLIACPAFDVFAGGARGPGKSAGLLGDWLAHCFDYPEYARGLLIRKTYPEMEEIEGMAQEMFPATRGKWHASSRTWRWPHGAFLRLRHLEREDDANKYLGHSYSYIGVDEAGQFSTFAGLDKLKGTLRSPHGIPVYFRATGNPGGAGHNLLKARYVDPAPPNTIFDAEENIGEHTVIIERCFIPATLDDNLVLNEKDPTYWERIVQAASGREDLLKAWRFGQWDIVAGGMFDDLWRPEIHILEPFSIPTNWYLDRSHDWGDSKPFCTLWFARSNGEQLEDGRFWPAGTLFVIAEDYGWNGKPNEGLRLSGHEIALRVKAVDALYHGHVRPGPGDLPPIQGGHSIEQDMRNVGIRWLAPSKGRGSRVTGWNKIRALLLNARDHGKERIGLYVFSTCRHVIRTVPILPRDTKNPDDVDSSVEDHAADALRSRVLAMPSEGRVLPLRF